MCTTQKEGKDLYSSLREEDLHAGMYDEDGCYNSTLFQLTEAFLRYERFSDGLCVLTMVSGVLGIACNIFTVLVLLRKEMKSCFNHILIAVNFFDSLHILFAIMDSARNSFSTYYPQYLLAVFPYVNYPFYRISLCGTIYLIIGVAVERYLAVCRPHHYREVQSKGFRSFVYIVPSILLSFIINTPRFLETETATACLDLSSCDCSDGPYNMIYLKPTTLRLNREYIIYYGTWGWVVLTGLLPFLVLLVLNYQIYMSLRLLKQRINKSTRNTSVATNQSLQSTEPGNLAEKLRQRRAVQQNKECNLAVVLIATVLMFFACHLPRVLTSVYEAVNIHGILDCREKGRDLTPLWFLYVMSIIQYLQVLNASINLPIYLFASKNFKDQTVEVGKTLINYFRSKRDEDPGLEAVPIQSAVDNEQQQTTKL